jgi:hypothetical protein
VGGGADEACSVRIAAPRTEYVEELVAMTVMVVCAVMLLGAVYRPLWVMLPVVGLTAQAMLVPVGKF